MRDDVRLFDQPHHIEVSILTVFPVNQHDNNTSNDNSIDLKIYHQFLALMALNFRYGNPNLRCRFSNEN